MFGILITAGIILSIILSCEAILYHNKRNGVSQEVVPSSYSPDHMNIVTHVTYKGVAVRNFCEMAHMHEAKWVALKRVKSAKRFYKLNKKRL